MSILVKALRGSLVFGLRLVRDALDSVLGADEQRPAPRPPQSPPDRVPSARSAQPRPAPTPAPRPRRESVVERPVALAPETHISEEPELVAESADEGAADGPGPEIRVDEPWDGYAKLKAKDVIDRVSTVDDAELAAVELYEASHRARRTVIAAAEKELRRRTASR